LKDNFREIPGSSKSHLCNVVKAEAESDWEDVLECCIIVKDV
jgi:hypothetical protein